MLRCILVIGLVLVSPSLAWAQRVPSGCPDPSTILSCVACEGNRDFVCPRLTTDGLPNGVVFRAPGGLSDFQAQGIVKELDKQNALENKNIFIQKFNRSFMGLAK